MIYYSRGSASDVLSNDDLQAGLNEALDKLGTRKKVMALPPDFTRFHSRAGILTELAWEYYGEAMSDVMPALGTHFAMTDEELSEMFGSVPKELFRVHDWKQGLTTLGRVPADFMREVSEGKLDFDWPAQVNTLLAEGGHDLVLSIGQVVPHEVIGMANYTKNIFVGTGGAEGINKSHFLGAVYGMERIMGRADGPVRAVLNYAAEKFAAHLPIVYVLTVVGRDETSGEMVTRGLFIGDDAECYYKAAELSLQVNFTMLDKPLKKVVVYLDPAEFKSSWLGNKAVYRTRMAIEDGGELIVLAPGVREFGEDPDIDKLIRKYGFRGTPATLKAVEENEDIRNNLSAAAHLIHASPEGRFTITWCPGHISREEIESVGFAYADLETMRAKYNTELLKDGYNTLPDGEEIYYISNPAIGLWAYKERFKQE